MTGMSSSVLMLSIGLLLQCVSSVDPGVGTLVPAPSPSPAAPPAPSSDSGAPSSPAASPPPSAPGAPSSAAPPSAPGHPSSAAPPPSAAAVSPAPGDPPSDSGALTPPPLYTSSAAAAAAAPAPSSDSGAPSSPAASPPPSAPGSPSSAAPPSAHVDPSSAAPPASAPGDASSAPDANSAPGGPTSSTGDLSSAPGAPTPAPSSPPSAPTVPAPFPGAHSSAKPTDLAPQKTTARTGSQGTDLLSSGSPGPAVTADRSSPLTTAPLVSTQKPQDPKTAEPVLPTSGRGTPSRPPSGHVTMRPATTARIAMAPTSEPQDRQNKASSGATVVHGTVGASAPGGSNPGLQIKTFSFPLTEDHKEYHVQTALCEKVMQGRAHCNCTASWPPQDPGAKLGPGDICIKVQCKDEDVNFPKSNSQLVVGDKTTLIAILASCGALLAMIIGLGIYATHHRKPYAENQQHLTEELHTVENGYHDNPTLDVMEVQPEMQEKKHIGNEFNDSWIVPMETIVKEVLPDEEDTHL